VDKKQTVISLLNQKGGSGKTTLATNIAHGFVIRGYKVLLVDTDAQGTARDWNSENEGSIVPVIGLDRETLPKDLDAVKTGYDIIILDGAPAIERMSAVAVKVSNIVLIPVQPSPYDIWATDELVELVKSRQAVSGGNPKAAFVISRVIKNTKLSKEVSCALSEYGLPIFEHYTSQLVVYPSTASKGFSVFSSAPNPACDEINGIIDELMEKFCNAKN
jgi:chromosome partitioning protein